MPDNNRKGDNPFPQMFSGALGGYKFLEFRSKIFLISQKHGLRPTLEFVLDKTGYKAIDE